MSDIPPINDYKVVLSNLELEFEKMKIFLPFAAEELGYSLYSVDDGCFIFELEAKPKNAKFLPKGKFAFFKYAKSMPPKFKLCFEGNNAVLDIKPSKLAIFARGKKVLNQTQNFLSKLYELKEDFQNRVGIEPLELTSLDEISEQFSKHHRYAPTFTFVLTGIFLLYYVVVAIVSKSSILDLSPQSLINLGGVWSTNILNGEWWRLLTGILLHSDIQHLFNNIAALISIGTLLEPRIGNLRFLIGFFVTGVIGASLYTMYNHFSVSVGASGGILGLYAIFFVLFVNKKVKLRRNSFWDLAILVIFTLVSGIFDPKVDNWGHYGGFLSGILVGLFYLLDFKGVEFEKKKVSVVAPILLGIIVPFYVVQMTPDYRSQFLQVAEKSDSLAQNSQSFYDLMMENPDAQTNQFLMAIENDIQKRTEALNLFRKAEQFRLDSYNRKFVNYMKEYLSAWLETYYILRAVYSDDTTTYKDPIDTLINAYLKLTKVIKKDSIYKLPEVWVVHAFLYGITYNRFVQMEPQALAYYTLLQNNAPTNELISALEDGNKIWSYFKDKMNGFDTLNIADENKQLVRLLQQYLNLRIDSYNALLNYYKNNDSNSLSLYESLSNKLSDVIAQINKVQNQK